MSLEPPPPILNPPPRSRKPIVIGFAIGAVIWLLPWFANLAPSKNGYDGIPQLIVAALLLPPVSVILAIIPATRRFGLGLLLACGLGWLVLGAICGGVFR